MSSEECCSGCSRPDLPWGGRGTDLPISGCRFTLYPMSDDYIEIILGALEKTDTSAVWSETDALSTVYRGKLPYVADAVQALFLNAYRSGVHMALEGQFSKGCPGVLAETVFWIGRERRPMRQRPMPFIFRFTVSWLFIPWEMQTISTRLQRFGTWQRREDFIRRQFIMQLELMETYRRFLPICRRSAS